MLSKKYPGKQFRLRLADKLRKRGYHVYHMTLSSDQRELVVYTNKYHGGPEKQEFTLPVTSPKREMFVVLEMQLRFLSC